VYGVGGLGALAGGWLGRYRVGGLGYRVGRSGQFCGFRLFTPERAGPCGWVLGARSALVRGRLPASV
jgi:hypothetical protein